MSLVTRQLTVEKYKIKWYWGYNEITWFEWTDDYHNRSHVYTYSKQTNSRKHKMGHRYSVYQVQQGKSCLI